MGNINTERFSTRASDYVKYRPGYPIDIIHYLEGHCQLEADSTIVDVGAGTGISSALFLDSGYGVIAIEPNNEMRHQAIEQLGDHKGFKAKAGAAEDTGLESKSVDLIVSGQAFHWFDRVRTKAEFKRILKPGGMVALLWNERKVVTPFEIAYDELILKHAIDYVNVNHRKINKEDIQDFFYPQLVELKIFENKQILNMEGLKGRLQSSSYMPLPVDPDYQAMITDLKILFNQYEHYDHVTVRYDTKLYVGHL